MSQDLGIYFWSKREAKHFIRAWKHQHQLMGTEEKQQSFTTGSFTSGMSSLHMTWALSKLEQVSSVIYRSSVLKTFQHTQWTLFTAWFHDTSVHVATGCTFLCWVSKLRVSSMSGWPQCFLFGLAGSKTSLQWSLPLLLWYFYVNFILFLL